MVYKKLKKKLVYVYVNSDKQAEKWKKLSREARVPISKFVVDHVENSISQESEEKYEPRAELRKQIQELVDENQDLRKSKRILELALEKLEKENRRYREKQWLDIKQQGVRGFERRLIDLLRNEGPLRDDQILSRLGIEPSEGDSVTAVANQLTSLQAWGVIRKSGTGWGWVNE